MTRLGTDVALHLPRELGTDLGGGGGVVPPTAPVLYGLQSFTTADFYQSVNNPGGIPGVATGFWIGVLFRIESQAVASTTREIASRLTIAPVSGWRISTSGLNDSLLMAVADQSGNGRTTPAYTITASDVGKIMLAVGVNEGSALKQYVNRLQVGTQSAITGYTLAADRMYLGKRAASSPLSSGTIFGMCGGHAVPTLAEVQAMADAVKLAGDIVGIPGKSSNLWSVKQDQAGSAPALLADKIGTENMQRQGAPVLVEVTSPVFGW